MRITNMAPLTPEQLTEVAINAIIAKAAILSRDPQLDKWKDVFRPAKEVIAEMNLPAEEEMRAIALLTEALRV